MSRPALVHEAGCLDVLDEAAVVVGLQLAGHLLLQRKTLPEDQLCHVGAGQAVSGSTAPARSSPRAAWSASSRRGPTARRSAACGPPGRVRINASSSPSKTSADGLSVTVSATGGRTGRAARATGAGARRRERAEIDQPAGHHADEQAGGGRRGHPAEQRPADQRTIRPRGRPTGTGSPSARRAAPSRRARIAVRCWLEPGRREHLVGLAGRVLAQALERGRQLRVPPGARFAPVQVLAHGPPIVRAGCLVAEIQRDQPIVERDGSDPSFTAFLRAASGACAPRETGARAPWIRSTR